MSEINRWKKIIHAMPFGVACIITLFSWLEIITTEYAATWKHYLALALIVLNAIFYIVRYKLAVMFTGFILVLAVFNLVTFFTIERTFSFGMRVGASHITTPGIQLISLLLFAGYFIISFDLLIGWYLDMKEKRLSNIK